MTGSSSWERMSQDRRINRKMIKKYMFENKMIKKGDSKNRINSYNF